jgi:hypothetical protein
MYTILELIVHLYIKNEGTMKEIGEILSNCSSRS